MKAQRDFVRLMKQEEFPNFIREIEMALTNAYLMTTKNLDAFLNAVVSAKAPDSFTNNFLKQLDFSSSNDRLYIGVLKALGLLDDSGKPTKMYFDFLDQTQMGKVLAKGIKIAYEDLFQVNTKAYELSAEQVKNKLKTLTQGQKSEKVLTLMATTFKALCEKADWEMERVVAEKKEEKEEGGPVKESEIQENSIAKSPNAQFLGGLHYNIQIHLPSTRDLSVYDAIFSSLKKHLV